MKALRRVQEDRAIDFADDSIARMIAGENLIIMYHDSPRVEFNQTTRAMWLPLGLKLSRIERLAIRAAGAASALFSTKQISSALPNIIEEIRVSNALMKKHRGMMRIFTSGHNSIFDRGVYGISRDEIAQVSPFDKAVLYFRLGAGAGIPIGPEERKLIEQIEALKNTDESIEFASTLNFASFSVRGNTHQISKFEDSLAAKAYDCIETLLKSETSVGFLIKKSNVILDIDRIPGMVNSIIEMANSTTFVETKTESKFERPKI